MAKKAFTTLKEGEPIVASDLNTNFTALAAVINSVDNNQFLREGISWESCNAVISGPNSGSITAANPVIQRAESSIAELVGTQTQNITLAPAASPVNLTDSTGGVFQVTLDSVTETPYYSFKTNDVVRYWFNAAVLFYNNTGIETVGEVAVIYPQFRFTVGGVVGPWLNLYPVPSPPYYVPAAIVGGAITGTGATYQTVRTAAAIGRGPGAWRSVALEGIIRIPSNSIQVVEIKMVAYGVGTTPGDLRIDLSDAAMQGCLLKNCYSP